MYIALKILLTVPVSMILTKRNIFKVKIGTDYLQSQIFQICLVDLTISIDKQIVNDLDMKDFIKDKRYYSLKLKEYILK